MSATASCCARSACWRLRSSGALRASFTIAFVSTKTPTPCSRARSRFSVCSGVYDEGYHEQTSIIGRVHVRIGLPQRYMLTAMALIRVALLRIADEKLG